jgi:hypothetical protein
MAKATTMMKTIADAITGNGKLDTERLKIENDQQLLEARKAEDEAVKRAHEAEGETAHVEAAERVADAAYDQASAGSDEGAIREARRSWIGAQEASRGHVRKVKALRAAAVEARHRREQTEVEAERRVAERIRQAISENIRRTRTLIEGPDGLASLAQEREQLLGAADHLSPWGSPQAARIGWRAGLGAAADELLGGRGSGVAGAHTINASVLGSGSPWDQFINRARDLGLAAE